MSPKIFKMISLQLCHGTPPTYKLYMDKSKKKLTVPIFQQVAERENIYLSEVDSHFMTLNKSPKKIKIEEK